MCPRSSLTMDNTFKLAKQGRTDSEKVSSPEVSYSDPNWMIFPLKGEAVSCPPHPCSPWSTTVPLSCHLSSGLSQMFLTSQLHILHRCRLFSCAVPGHSQILAPLLQSHHRKSECSPSELQISFQLAVLTAAHQQGNPHLRECHFPLRFRGEN